MYIYLLVILFLIIISTCLFVDFEEKKKSYPKSILKVSKSKIKKKVTFGKKI